MFQTSIDIHVRTLAVILLKNLVRGCWKDRGGPRRVVTMDEKSEVSSGSHDDCTHTHIYIYISRERDYVGTTKQQPNPTLISLQYV